jgi:alcohol dehydrogenase class IV
MNRFTLPRDIYFGKGSLEVLKTLRGKKAVVVTGGSSMRRFGFLQKVESYLKEAGMEVKLIEGVEPDPSVDTVMKGAAIMREFEPDWIVSIGGGSPIDAAKAMWIFYEHPEATFDDVKDPFTVPELRTKAKFAAIPSTSGTATEVTALGVYKPRPSRRSGAGGESQGECTLGKEAAGRRFPPQARRWHGPARPPRRRRHLR